MIEQLNILVHYKLITLTEAKRIQNSLNWYNETIKHCSNTEQLKQTIGYKYVQIYNKMIFLLLSDALNNTAFSLN